jgi:ubiquinol-cytochrome c reductase cytochrome c subunit
MHKKTTALLGATLALGLIGGAAAQQTSGGDAAPAAAHGNVARGKQLFVADGCYECHGYDAQGGVGLRLAPNPLPTAVIMAYIRNPAGEMPPYVSKVVSDQDVADIHAYLETIPKSPPLADIPELKN